ncbi:RNA polymerase sigma factor [Radiobacillus sp. PE A8.2]|uniref:RNA polymerase sigma factor n=1 Tax=Radiobacillus sp. PE A8.2 TaxID=3380349 RepID=UPI00388E7238
MGIDDTRMEEWFYKYSDDVYNFLIYYRGHSDVEDLVQDVYIKAIKGLASYRKDANPKTWLFQIARNVAIDDARRRQVRNDKIKINSYKDSLPIIKTPEQIYQLNEQKSELIQAIQRLKQNYREVLLLRGMKEFSVEETATILKWSNNKVRVTYHRALEALKKEVSKYE